MSSLMKSPALRYVVVAVMTAILLVGVYEVFATPNEHKATTVTAQPTKQSPTQTVGPSQKGAATPSAGVPSEQAPTGVTKSFKLSGVFEGDYPASWGEPRMGPDGTNDGSNGEVTLNQSPTTEFPNDGGIVTFRSLHSSIGKGVYGNDPVGHWKGQSCVDSSVQKMVGPIMYTATANKLEVQFYKIICTDSDVATYAGPSHFADIDYLWIVSSDDSGMQLFVVEATNGSSDGTHADVMVDPRPVSWTVNHGKYHDK